MDVPLLSFTGDSNLCKHYSRSAWLAKIFRQKKYLPVCCCMGNHAGYFILRLYGASNPVVYISIACLTILGAGLCYPLRQAMFMDAAEYSYYKTGKDASAFIMSMLTFPMKIGVTLAGTLATSGLAIIGYEAGMETTQQFTSRLMDIICYIPIGCGVITILCMIFYSLSDDKVEKYVKANTKKRAAEGAGA